jgi:hypothetical protein
MIKTTIFTFVGVLLAVTSANAGDGKDKIQKRDEIHSSYRFHGLSSNYSASDADFRELKDGRYAATKYREKYDRF